MMTRDEFVTRCDDLSAETKYSSKPWHIWLAEMTAHDAEQRAEIARLWEALKIYREASFQSHNGHWDMTMQHGAGCLECIRARELRAKANHIIAQQALKESIK